MQLGSGANHFQLNLVGYQYPGVARDRYDLNWLMAEGTVRHAGGTWTFRDPCLLTWEASALAAWLEALSSGQVTAPELEFVEPNLSFSSLSASELRVSFALEALPPQERSSVDSSFSLVFAVDVESLRRGAQDLHAQLTQFPVREAQ